MADVQLAVPARPEYVSVVRHVVAELAGLAGFLDDRRRFDLKLAVSEATTNAVEANADHDVADQVTVHCRLDDHVVEIVVEDHGGGFDPDGLATLPPFTEPERLRYERGLGIPLIRALTDDAEFVSSTEGTAVRVAMFDKDRGP